MSNFTEKYDIKDLYIVKLNDDLLNNIGISNEFVNYFNSNLYYIVERFCISEDNINYYEMYKECIIGEDFYSREGRIEIQQMPEVFESMNQLPLEYLDEEEIKKGEISTIRIFQIFQEINFQKVKKVGRKK